MALATDPEAAPTNRNQRATSWPAPISAKEPKIDGSRFRVRALRWVSSFSLAGIKLLGGRLEYACVIRCRGRVTYRHVRISCKPFGEFLLRYKALPLLGGN